VLRLLDPDGYGRLLSREKTEESEISLAISELNNHRHRQIHRQIGLNRVPARGNLMEISAIVYCINLKSGLERTLF
jgi:hypothetical protein